MVGTSVGLVDGLIPGRAEWPEGYMAGSHLSGDDLQNHRSGLDAFLRGIREGLHDRSQEQGLGASGTDADAGVVPKSARRDGRWA